MLSIIIPSHKETDLENMERSCRFFFPYAEIITSKDEDGLGKGWAIRYGIMQASGDLIAIIDGDLDINPAEIYPLLYHLGYHDVVIGYKDLKKLPPRRRLVSFGYRLLIRLMFRLRIKDSQTGLKIWKREWLPDYESNDFSFDVELLLKARKANLRIKEVPINCRVYSSVKFSSIFKTLWGTLKIWINDRRGLYNVTTTR
jgi:glycosyltransferase involved in cell wall biosynthesis